MNKDSRDNRSRQLNPQDPTYQSSRGDAAGTAGPDTKRAQQSNGAEDTGKPTGGSTTSGQ